MQKNEPIITITTDFGDDFALSQVKAAILSINPGAQIITISNQISQFSVLEGAFVLSEAASLFPKGTTHIGVVDPGVGSSREGVVIKTSDYIFIGPNNGLFSKVVNGAEVYRIKEAVVSNNHSVTFHGRDVFAKIAALLSIGNNILEFAEPIQQNKLVHLPFKFNQVIHIDHYGNIKINNQCENFKTNDTLKIQINHTSFTLPFVKTFSDVDQGRLLAYKGSHNILEIAKNLGSANEQLNFQIGDILKIEKIEKKC